MANVVMHYLHYAGLICPKETNLLAEPSDDTRLLLTDFVLGYEPALWVDFRVGCESKEFQGGLGGQPPHARILDTSNVGRFLH